MSKALKPSTTVSEQIKLLQSRGMNVDTVLAEQWLTNVSYYRLSAYWFPAKLSSYNSDSQERFRLGTDFRDVVALYEADRKLRTLIHDGIERIEVAVRTRIAQRLCETQPDFYLKPENFRPNFHHGSWLNIANKRIQRVGTRNESIKHYVDEYDSKFPFWVLAEVLDFADLSRLFDGLYATDQRAIAEGLGININLKALSKNQQNKVIKNSPLARWLEQLTIIRNACAHHSRLWNKSFAPAPTAALKTQIAFSALPDGQSERLFGAITVMTQLLKVISPGTTWPNKVASLINNDFLCNPLVDKSSMGIPDNWNGKF